MFLLLFFVLAICLALAGRHGGEVYQLMRNREVCEKFPPLSDQEFLAKCDPGTNPEIALKVRRILSDSLGIDYELIHPSASLVKDLDAC